MMKNGVLVVAQLCLLLCNLAYASTPRFDERYLAWKAQQEAHDRRLTHNQTTATSSAVGQSSTSGRDTQTATTAPVSPVVATITVHLNQANIQQLQQLKGVGEKKARAIIEYREQHGSFKQIEELKQVKGIGESIFLKNQAQLAL